MATQFDYLADGMHSNLGVNLNRQKYAPLDGSSVFKSIADLEYYIKKGAYDQGLIPEAPSPAGLPDYVTTYMTHYPYVGQVVSIVENGTVKVYKITDVAACTYEQIDSTIAPGDLPIAGKGTLGAVSIGDGLSISSDGTLSVAVATADTIGGVKIGAGIDIAPDGTISAAKVTVDLDFSATSSDNPIATSAVHERLLSSENKLSGVEDGAEVNVISGIYLNGNYVQPDENRNVRLDTALLVTVTEDGENVYVADEDLASINQAYAAGRLVQAKFGNELLQLDGVPTADFARFAAVYPASGETLLNGTVIAISKENDVETVSVQTVDSGQAVRSIAVEAVEAAAEFVPLSVASEAATETDRLVISSEVSAAINEALVDLAGAMHFLGTVTPEEGQTDREAIDDRYPDPCAGDVVVITTTSKEYIFDGASWIELGDESLYATKSELESEIQERQNADETLSGGIKAAADALAELSGNLSAFTEEWKNGVDQTLGELTGTAIPGITSDISSLSDDLNAITERIDNLSVSQLIWDIDEINCGDSGYVPAG